MDGKLAKLATVLPPITMTASAMAYKSFTIDTAKERNIWVPTNYDLQIFIHSRHKTDWIEPWKVYLKPDGMSWLFKLFFSLVNGKFHLFVCHNGPEGLLTFMIGKLLRKPVIVKDSSWFSSTSLLFRLYWPFARFVAMHPTVLCVVGSRVLSYWREAGLSVDDAKVVHFYASQAEVKTANLTAAQQFREKYGRRKVILYFGRLIKRKGIDYLIKAFAVVSKEIPEAILVIAGDGPEKHSLQNLCKELGLNDVIFTGYVSEEEKATILLSCDLFVYPTITINVPEEWGLAVNEAMSVGKPAIVTNAVGCAFDLVQPEITGFVVPEKDILNLSYAIRKALTDDAARIRMGKASKELIEREYTYACMDSKMNDIVKKILYR